ncbi:MAG: glucose-6-phosphate isomerase [Candidatus Brocadiia bacterium]
MAETFRGTDLDHNPAFRALARLARQPVDLTAPGALSPRRIERLRASAAGFDLLYATQRVTDDVVDALGQLAEESQAVDQFAAMMGGAVMNHIEGWDSEQRQVLHTASRDLFADLPCPHDDEAAAANAGQQLDRLEAFLAALDGEHVTDLVQVGIGGSDLGPRALYMALPQCRLPGRRVHFVSNVDPDDAAYVLEGLDLGRTLVAVVSKSGTTQETVTNEALVAQRFRQQGLEPAAHFVAVTGEGSPMDDRSKYREVFHMYDYIGGRYSATSMVGGVCLGFGLGIEAFRQILRGAREMDLAALEPDPRANPPLLAALLGIWNRNFLGCETLAILPYSQALARFVAHLQQLDMESNGKRVNRRGEALATPTGPIVWGEPGTNGQHAFYQLLHQGATVVPCEFIGFRKSQSGFDLEVEGTTSQEKLLANLLAQTRALAEGRDDDNPNRCFPGNRPSSLLIAEQLDPRTLGALLAFYEAKVAFQGFLWNINSFDQEGVQLGKRLAGDFLRRLKARKAHPACPRDDDPTGWAMIDAAGV